MAEEINVAEAAEEAVEERAIVFEEALEAILFAAGHPVSYATLARVFEMTPAKVKDKVFEYAVKYNDPEIPRGVVLLTYGDSCQLSTKQHYLHEIRDALGIKKSGSLSTSSMEALAIVAYNQPVTRIFVDTLRRADSSYAMNNLLDRGLIESKGRLDAPGRPMLYGTTSDFLRVFGLGSISELPRTTEDMQAMFAKAQNTEQKEEATQEEIQFPEDDENANQEKIEFPESESSDDEENDEIREVAEFIEEAAHIGSDESDVSARELELSADDAVVEDELEPSADEDITD